MQNRSRFFTFLSALFVLVVLGVTTGVSLGDNAAPSMVMESLLEESVDQSFAPAEESVDECFVPAEEAADDSSLYECPKGVSYCQRDSQCSAQCGSVDFGVCFQGCCYCAG